MNAFGQLFRVMQIGGQQQHGEFRQPDPGQLVFTSNQVCQMFPNRRQDPVCHGFAVFDKYKINNYDFDPSEL